MQIRREPNLVRWLLVWVAASATCTLSACGLVTGATIGRVECADGFMLADDGVTCVQEPPAGDGDGDGDGDPGGDGDGDGDGDGEPSGTDGGMVTAGPQQVYFGGYIYDGVTRERLQTYEVEIRFGATVLTASVDATGRYFVGPLSSGHDWSVLITAEGYRPFASHNAYTSLNAGATSLLYDAFLYPSDLLSPADEVSVFLSDVQEQQATGRVRFAPTTASSLFDEDVETPAGVDRQVWINDEDQQAGTLVLDVSGGQASIPEGALAYGVTYRVTVFSVPGYVDVTDTYQAGVDSSPAFILSPQMGDPLQLVYDTRQLGVPVPTGAVTFVFNRPIEPDPLDASPLNGGFPISIDSPDADEDTFFNVLADAVSTISIQGTTLTLVWDEDESLEAMDADDPIYSVTYGGLNALYVRPTGGNLASRRSLGELVGGNTVSVTLEGQ